MVQGSGAFSDLVTVVLAMDSWTVMLLFTFQGLLLNTSLLHELSTLIWNYLIHYHLSKKKKKRERKGKKEKDMLILLTCNTTTKQKGET